MAVRHDENRITSSFLPTSAEVEDLRELARFGALPDAPGLAKLCRTISSAPAQLQRYDTEITKLQKDLDRLVSERSALDSYTGLCRSVLSPVQKLPNELLADIFDLCFPIELYSVSSAGTGTSEVDRLACRYLLQLAQVCSRWHRVAMETPRLWSTMSVHTDLWDGCLTDSNTLLNLLESSLTRSQEHLLNLNLRVSNSSSGDLVLKSLLQHEHRWKYLQLCSRDSPSEFLSAGTRDLDCLVGLALNVKLWGNMSAFRNAPSLKELAFAGHIDDLPMLPWTQIESLTFDSLRIPNPM
ncbi:hypothetical protein R3P38DRAFT_2496772 [Favolaschia claudopus]|uniref:F-box domain-containing protein n=1 Tax=Favolaschia claudopus TaxID=2862362 RepID=A0AAW0E0D0_9AGAR